MIEPVPHISFDFGMGDIVSDFEINYDALVAYMKSQGFDDETISDTEIHILSYDASLTDESGEVYYPDAVLDVETGQIGLFPAMARYSFLKEASVLSDKRSVNKLRKRMSTKMSANFSKFLVHELGHKKRHPSLEADAEESKKVLAKRSIGNAAVNSLSYLYDAEEAECDEAAKNGPKNLISFQIKPITND